MTAPVPLAASGWIDVAPAAAHRELLARVLADTRVVTVRDDAGWSAWLVEQIARAWARMIDSLIRAVDAVGVGNRSLLAIAAGIALAVAAALIWQLVAAIRRRRTRRPAAGEPDVAAVAATEGPGAGWGVGAWRAEIDRRLAAGRVREALEAVWWWLARALAGPRAAASWTGRELLAHSGRPDLAPLLGRLDAFAYGPAAPETAAVRELTRGLEGRIGPPAGAGGEADRGGGDRR